MRALELIEPLLPFNFDFTGARTDYCATGHNVISIVIRNYPAPALQSEFSAT